MSHLKRAPLISEKSWASLQEYYDSHGKNLRMIDMFSEDPDRFKKFRFGGFPHLQVVPSAWSNIFAQPLVNLVLLPRVGGYFVSWILSCALLPLFSYPIVIMTN